MWSALEGSILLWVLVLSGYTAAVAWRFRRRTEDPLVGWALVVMFVVMAFFVLIDAPGVALAVGGVALLVTLAWTMIGPDDVPPEDRR